MDCCPVTSALSQRHWTSKSFLLPSRIQWSLISLRRGIESKYRLNCSTFLSSNPLLNNRYPPRSCEIRVELPEVEMNDGNRLCLLSSTFPKGSTITPCYSDDPRQDSCRIPCKLTFRSPKPVSFATNITFVVGKERYGYAGLPQLLTSAPVATTIKIPKYICIN